jgi:2-polyprenyl-3-methyl-5-hydroxy-6-metoxy-1,4-benzoquinol methylase
MISKEWFNTWFDTSYYHQLYKNRDEEEANLFISSLVDFLKLPAKSKVMDLACGKGRHAKTLNDLGMDVLGVDLSPNSIELASALKNNSLDFQVHDMREVLDQYQFKAVFNLFTSFGYFDDVADNRRVMHAIHEMLEPKGYLVIDFMNVDKITANLVSKEEKVIDGISFDLERRNDGKHIYKDIRFHDENQFFHFTERVQELSLGEFKELLIENNFRLLNTFGDFHLNPFDPINSDRLILIAQKL